MRETKTNKLKRLEEIRDKIEDDGTSLSLGIKLLAEASEIHHDLQVSLFKKSGEIKIVKEEESGTFSLHEFEEDG